MRFRQLRISGFLPAPHLFRCAIYQFPIMIAANRGYPLAKQKIARKTGFQRTAEAIAKIDDIADALFGDILKNGLQRRAVSVDVGDGGKDHDT